MAQIIDNNTIIFDDLELNKAWENSPEIQNSDNSIERMCYICKLPMKKNNFVEWKNIDTSWCIDFIDVKHFSTDTSNLIAVHKLCVDHRPKKDAKKLLTRIKGIIWRKPEGEE